MISSSENRVSYDGDGLAKEFAYQFKILEKSDIKVMLVKPDGSTQILNKDYYVDAEKSVVLYPGYAPGAEIPESERPPILPTGWRLVLYREVPITQLSKLLEQWPFNIIEDGLDKLTIICQQLKDGLMRSLHIDESHASDVDTTVPWQPGKSFRIADDGKSIVLTEDPARVLPLAQNALEAARVQAQNALEAARQADGYMQGAILAQENAAELARSAATSEQNADKYQQAANAYKKAAAESEKAAQNYMSAAGQYWQEAQAAASVARDNAQKAAETAAGIKDIADEVAKIHEYLDAAQQAANSAAEAESNALNFAQAARKAAGATSEMLEAATSQATNAEASAQLAQTQAQEANKFAVGAADSAEQARILLETINVIKAAIDEAEATVAQNKTAAETAANTATQKAEEATTLINDAFLATMGLKVVDEKICMDDNKEA